MSASANSPHHLRVDWTRCDGHGLCAALLPERIQLDEWGFPVLHRPAVSADDELDVRRAVAACPALALYLTAP
jgi:ferredoxin